MTESHCNSCTQKACKRRWKHFSTKKKKPKYLFSGHVGKYSKATAEIFMEKELETPEGAEDASNHELHEGEERKVWS